MAKKVRIYVLDLTGGRDVLHLRVWQTDILLRRIVELQKGQTLTIRVEEDTPTKIAALDEFEGW